MPRESGSGPETVPLASRSPGRRLQPLQVWCATICAIDQYSSLRFPRLKRNGAMPLARICALVISTSSVRSIAPRARFSAESRYGSGAGSPSGRA